MKHSEPVNDAPGDAMRPWNPLDALSEQQRGRLARYRELLLSWNRRLNLISRESERDVEKRHLVHSLTLTRRAFPAGSVLVDWGTGGGLPAIPLAIALPHVTVHAVDSVEKKILAVRAMARELGLENLHAWAGRAEAWPETANYSVSRAAAPLSDLWQWHRRVARPLEVHDSSAWPPGLLCLKGGDLSDETAALTALDPAAHVEQTPLKPLVGLPEMADKVLVAVRHAGA